MKLNKILCLGLIATSVLAFNIPIMAEEIETENQIESETISEYNTADEGITPYGIYKYKVIANNVNVRKSPSTSATSIGQMNWGDVVYSSAEPISREGILWLYVTCGSPLTGKTGYIAYQYLQAED